MDTHTLELLGFDKIRELVAARAACSLGKEAARRMQPSRDPREIRDCQVLTTEMTEALGSGLMPPFGGLHDIRRQLTKAHVGAMLDPKELAETSETLRAIGGLDHWLGMVGNSFPRLGGLKTQIGEFSGVINAIECCIDSRGQVLDTASRKLSTLRREIGQVEDRIQEILRRMLRSPELKRILRYPNFTMVGHHYVLPIAKEHRAEIQGSVQRTSASNETVFIEPQVIAEQSAQLFYLRSREAKEVRRILRWLSAQIGQEAVSLLESLQTLAKLDLIFARARYGIDYCMTPPDFNQEGKLVLRGARHPLLDALFRAEKALPRAEIASEDNAANIGVGADGNSVETDPASTLERASSPARSCEARTVMPIDVNLGLRFRILVVTGPNTGGKTVALKTVGLLAVMAQAGLHIPTQHGAQLPVFDAVLADIGDEQSLEQSLSTFSSHVRRVAEILARASDNSLILLDELGAGTDPAEGAALGRAILDELDSIGCRAIVTTHIGDLKTYAFTNPRAENAAVEFDLETLQPRYRLHIGDIGQSNALEIARRLELPEHLVARAGRYLDQNLERNPPEVEIVRRIRKEAEEARQGALKAQAEADRMRAALNQRLADLQQQAEQDARLVEARELVQPGDRVVVPRFGYDRTGRIVRLDHRKKTALVAIGQMQWNVSIDELIPQVLRTPQMPAAGKPNEKLGGVKPLPSLEDFQDDPASP